MIDAPEVIQTTARLTAFIHLTVWDPLLEKGQPRTTISALPAEREHRGDGFARAGWEVSRAYSIQPANRFAI